ncbi:unnamed protein product [Urochloa humidicola]
MVVVAGQQVPMDALPSRRRQGVPAAAARDSTVAIESLFFLVDFRSLDRSSAQWMQKIVVLMLLSGVLFHHCSNLYLFIGLAMNQLVSSILLQKNRCFVAELSGVRACVRDNVLNENGMDGN